MIYIAKDLLKLLDEKRLDSNGGEIVFKDIDPREKTGGLTEEEYITN